MRPIADFIFEYFPATNFCIGYKILEISLVEKFRLSAFITVHIKAGNSALPSPIGNHAISPLIFSLISVKTCWRLATFLEIDFDSALSILPSAYACSTIS